MDFGFFKGDTLKNLVSCIKNLTQVDASFCAELRCVLLGAVNFYKKKTCVRKHDSTFKQLVQVAGIRLFCDRSVQNLNGSILQVSASNTLKVWWYLMIIITLQSVSDTRRQFWESLTTLQATFHKIFNGLLLRSIL